MRIDSHQHFWVYNPSQHVWMTDRMSVLKRDYLPQDMEPLLERAGIGGTIAVQARQMVEETEWLLELADRYPFIRGVVGWVDLRSPNVRDQLEGFSRYGKLRGVRHVVHDEPDDRFALLPAFQRGIEMLREFGLTYDLLLYPRHLPAAIRLVEKFPDQPFVLDHIGKPPIRDRQLSPWREDLRALALLPNVWCKLSGMVTEANWERWRADDFRPCLDIVLDAFGTARVMIGSDWPVCTLAGDYAAIMQIVIGYVSQFPPNVREQILGDNCARFYGV